MIFKGFLHSGSQVSNLQSDFETWAVSTSDELYSRFITTPLETRPLQKTGFSIRKCNFEEHHVSIRKCTQTHFFFQFQNGDTALHIAAAMGRRKLTRVLLESGCNKDVKNKVKKLTRCLKISEKVSFNIKSEASNVYILSGQKFIKNAKHDQFWRVFENLKLAVKQCYQTGQF